MHVVFPKLEKYQRLILKKMDRQNEYHLHGYAWFTTYVEAIRQLVYWYNELCNERITSTKDSMNCSYLGPEYSDEEIVKKEAKKK